MKQDSGRYEIRLSGSGGQGIVLAGMILADALSKKKKFVAQTQSYGPEARGGNCLCEVIASEEEIDYPRAIALDVLLALSQEGCDANWHTLKPKGLLIVDSGEVKHLPPRESIGIPFNAISQKTTGGKLSANMAALGALAQLSSIVSLKALEEAIAGRSPKQFLDANTRACRMGARAAKRDVPTPGAKIIVGK